VSAQGRERVQQLKLCKHDKKTVQKKIAQQKRMCLKLSAEVAAANFKQKNKCL
jgi:hypothetical protein